MNISGGHTELIQFDVIELGDHQIILGILWIKYHNPTINWTLERITFEGYSYISRAALRKSQMKIYMISLEKPGY